VSEAELAEVVPSASAARLLRMKGFFVLGMTHSIATQFFPDPHVHEATEHLVEKSLSFRRSDSGVPKICCVRQTLQKRTAEVKESE
jgi:hypothetical protein